MDIDTAVFLAACERQATQARTITEDQVMIAFLLASTDVLGKVSPDAAGLDPKIVKWNGPAGGNPLLSITGYPDQLREALINVFDMPADQASLYLRGR